MQIDEGGTQTFSRQVRLQQVRGKAKVERWSFTGCSLQGLLAYTGRLRQRDRATNLKTFGTAVSECMFRVPVTNAFTGTSICKNIGQFTSKFCLIFNTI